MHHQRCHHSGSCSGVSGVQAEIRSTLKRTWPRQLASVRVLTLSYRSPGPCVVASAEPERSTPETLISPGLAVTLASAALGITFLAGSASAVTSYHNASPAFSDVAAGPPPTYVASLAEECPLEAPKPSGWGLPWYCWVGVGFLAANTMQKVLDIAKTGPEQMQQMVKPNNEINGTSTTSPLGGSSGSSKSSSDSPPMPPAIDATPRPPPTPFGPPLPPSFQQPTNQKSASFTDAESSSSPSNGSTSNSGKAQPSKSFKDAQESSSSAGGEADAQPGDSSLVSSFEFMLADTRMQKMLMSTLPEEMRNPERMRAMLKDPATRKLMEKEMQEWMKGMPPNVIQELKNMSVKGPKPLDNPEYKKQFEAVGTTPEEVMQKMVNDPELLRGMQNPRVMKAVMEVSSNPLAVLNYKDDQEVYSVLMRMQQLLSPKASK